MVKKIIFTLLLLMAVTLAGVPQASATPTYKAWFEANYSAAVNSRIDTCLLCHVNPDPLSSGNTDRNSYGADFGRNGHNFTAIESLDSDGDGFTNIDEIHNLTFPGNASDFPSMAAPSANVTSSNVTVPTFNISGFKINNATGSGISGWNITLMNSTMKMGMTTGVDGSYMFTNLANDTYNVTEEMQTGWMNVSPMSRQVTINGTDVMNVNFTNTLITPSNRSFTAHLVGNEEVPPTDSSAEGQATFELGDNGTTLRFNVTVTNITNATASHIHLAPVGVNGSIVVVLYPGPTKAGRFDGVLAEGNITQANLTGPLAGQPLSALLDNMTDGNTYVNVHTTQHPGGEIRGQIQVAPSANVTPSMTPSMTPSATPSNVTPSETPSNVTVPTGAITSFILTPDMNTTLKGTPINITISAPSGNMSQMPFNGTADINIIANNVSAVSSPANVSFTGGNATIQVTSSIAQFVTVTVTGVTGTNNSMNGSTQVMFADKVFNLSKGWNLISIPNFADPSSVNQTLQHVQNNGVIGFDPLTGNFTTPTDLEPLFGYWINVTADNQSLGFIASTNIPSTPPTRKLFEGWNLIGVSASRNDLDTLNSSQLFVDLKQGPDFTQWLYTRLVSFDQPAAPVTLVAGTDLSDLTSLQQGHGYWLFIKHIPNNSTNNIPWAGKQW